MMKSGISATKITVTGILLSVLVVALSAGPAEASTQETCVVNAVLFQVHTAAVPNDLLLIGCADGTSYNAYIGTAGTGCYSDADAVKSLETIALSARITGNPLTIWWNAQSCPGNSGARVIESITM